MRRKNGAKDLPKMGLISEKEQYICPYCVFDFVVNPPPSKKYRNRAEKREEVIRKKLKKQEKPEIY